MSQLYQQLIYTTTTASRAGLLANCIGRGLGDSDEKRLDCRLEPDQLIVDLVSLLQEGVDVGDGFLAVVLIFDGINGATRPRGQSVLELGILAETTSVAKERILFVVVDGATLVALEHVLTTEKFLAFYFIALVPIQGRLPLRFPRYLLMKRLFLHVYVYKRDLIRLA